MSSHRFCSAALCVALCTPVIYPFQERPAKQAHPGQCLASAPTSQLRPHSAAGRDPEAMVWIPGGNFWMGSDQPMFPDARPLHQVHVGGFWMDRTTVTNE